MQSIGIWNEKYRPMCIDDVVCNEAHKAQFKSYIQSRTLPHLLFSGIQGAGKSTTAKILANNITNASLYINASDETGIDVVRNKIKDFVTTQSLDDIQIVILDEFDYFTVHAQAALRDVMERFHGNSRFILTCNYIQRVLDPIISRCQVYEFTGGSKRDVAKRCLQILKSEKVEYEAANVADIISAYFPDIRSIINALQQLSVPDKTGRLILHPHKEMHEKTDRFIAWIKGKNLTAIRTELASRNYSYPELYRYIFDHVSDIVSDRHKQLDMYVVIAEYMFRNSQVVDPEINFSACMIEIMRILGNE